MDNSIIVLSAVIDRKYGTIFVGDYVIFDIDPCSTVNRYGKVIKIDRTRDEISIEEPGGHIVIRSALFDYNAGRLKKLMPYDVKLDITREQLKEEIKAELRAKQANYMSEWRKNNPEKNKAIRHRELEKRKQLKGARS